MIEHPDEMKYKRLRKVHQISFMFLLGFFHLLLVTNCFLAAVSQSNPTIQRNVANFKGTHHQLKILFQMRRACFLLDYPLSSEELEEQLVNMQTIIITWLLSL